MKKCSLFGFFVVLFTLFSWGNAMEVQAEEYSYLETEVESGSGTVTEGRWYVGEYYEREMIDGMPDAANLGYNDVIKIQAAPDAECAQWLQNLSGDLGDFSVNIAGDAEVQIGSPEVDLSLYAITIRSGQVTAYAETGMLSVYCGNYDEQTTYGGTVIHHGDVRSLYLGCGEFRENDEVLTGDIQINGNVQDISWYKVVQPEEVEDTYYLGYVGDVTISGTVGSGTIHTAVYDDVIDRVTFHVTGEFSNCEAGTVSMTDGVLANTVSVTPVTPTLGNYTFEYQCYPGDGITTKWSRYVYNTETGEFAFLDPYWPVEDIPANSKVMIFGIATPVELNVDVDELSIMNNQQGRPIDFTLNGNVNSLYIDVYAKGDCDITINGDINSILTTYRYNPEYNFTVTGEVKDASYQVRRNGDFVTMGYYAVENMPIIIDGDWNPEIFMHVSKDEDALAYNPIKNETISSVLDDEEVGKEIVVSTDEGDKTLIKAAEVLMQGIEEDVWNLLKQREEFIKKLQELYDSLSSDEWEVQSANAVCAMDIFVNTYYADKNTGEAYEEDDNYGREEVKELDEDENLPISIKIPTTYYDEDAEYSIIREHENEDGSTRMDVIKPEREGNVLKFHSDRFSTFVIVKSEGEDIEPAPAPTVAPTAEPTVVPTTAPTAEPTVVPTTAPTAEPTVAPTTEPTTEPTVTPTTAPGNEAEVQVESFVTRMYTVVLDRNPDPAGIADWKELLLKHEIDGAGIAYGFIMSEEFLNKALTDEEYVDVLYATFFDRAADEGGKATWMGLLAEGSSRGYVLSGFVNSNEFDVLCESFGILRGTMKEDGSAVNVGIRQFVERCYSTVLGRTGDKEGLDTWTTLIITGQKSAEEVAKSFFDSEEFIGKNTTDADYIDILYATFLDRVADDAGRSDWTGYLAGGMTRTEVLEGFSRSEEFKGILASYGLQ